MRSALLCVFFALIVHKEGKATTNEDFKPTPIPLNDWHVEKKDGLTGTLQEIATEAPPATAAVPAHYWEDALRHSVYLTLVRDKIDQLIAKGSVISPDNKLEHASKEIDDHNLWEKIKAAPFDRLSIEEPAVMGDITIMSKGRLLEEKNGYRFTEDKSSKEKCNEEKCMNGVKAFWSVKRVRQRDAETTPGKYHYELTFSVNSQPPKKIKKPYDNPVRTFTVREGSPVEQPQNPQPPIQAQRPQRAVWVHKNIAPSQHYQSRKTYQPQGLDRFFLSLFSDEEDEPPRKPSPYVQQGYHVPQHSKVGYAGAPSNDQYQHKKPGQYPYKPTTYKYSRPPLGPPPSVAQAEHHYTDSDKMKIQFSPPKVQFRYPDSDGKPRNPQLQPQISPPQGPPQYNDPIKTKNQFPNIQPQFPDSDKTPSLYPQIEPQYNIDPNNQQVPFSQQVQHFLDEVKSKHPYPHPQTKYHYDVKAKVQPPNNNQQHHYREPDVKTNIQYPPQPDYRYQPSNVVKTTRPAILPTPPGEPLNITMEVTDKLNLSETTTKDPEIVTAFRPYVKPPVYKPPPTKVSYFPEHIRPPVFNAPPGVFVTMDKKPFKPMPPLKYHHNHHPHNMHSKPVKSRPGDFRPSPQVVDVQLFSDPDPLSDAFRPMNVNYSDNSTSSSETSEKDGTTKHKNVHHKNLHKSKPPKKHELNKSQRATTSTPDIITVPSQSIEESDSMHWASNLLSAFVKTTPMASEETKNTTLTDTDIITTYEPTTTEQTTTVATTTEAKKEETTTASTTPKPKKRTRPPPKFTKQEKLKKHKRVTTTTTTSTTTTTTEKPRSKRPAQDLTPQASSAATGTKSGWQPKSKIHNDTTTSPDSVMTSTSTTTRPTTTYRTTTKATTTTRPTLTTTTAKPTTTTPTPIPETEIPAVTTPPKSMNRFRISTLMQKGTSVNHDKWSLPTIDTNNGTKTKQFSGKGSRRKGSNFQGYISSTPKNIDEDHHNEEHIDVPFNTNEVSSTTEMLLEVIPVTPEPSPVKSDDDESDYPSVTEEPDAEDMESNESDGESKDHSEYIFSTKETTVQSKEIVESPNQVQDVKKETVENTPHTVVKNKTKCKKKKHMNLTTTEDPDVYSDSIEVLEIVASTEEPTTEADIFAQIFGSYTVAGLSHDNQTKEPIGEGSENQERFAQIDDDLEDFLDSIEDNKNDKYDHEKSYEQYDEDDSDEESDYSPFNNEEESRSPRHADVNYEEYRDRPYSFLELMAME